MRFFSHSVKLNSILSLKKNPPNLFTQGDIKIQSTNGHNYSVFDRFSPFINKINTYINDT